MVWPHKIWEFKFWHEANPQLLSSGSLPLRVDDRRVITKNRSFELYQCFPLWEINLEELVISKSLSEPLCSHD